MATLDPSAMSATAAAGESKTLSTLLSWNVVPGLVGLPGASPEQPAGQVPGTALHLRSGDSGLRRSGHPGHGQVVVEQFLRLLIGRFPLRRVGGARGLVERGVD